MFGLVAAKQETNKNFSGEKDRRGAYERWIPSQCGDLVRLPLPVMVELAISNKSTLTVHGSEPHSSHIYCKNKRSACNVTIISCH